MNVAEGKFHGTTLVVYINERKKIIFFRRKNAYQIIWFSEKKIHYGFTDCFLRSTDKVAKSLKIFLKKYWKKALFMTQ